MTSIYELNNLSDSEIDYEVSILEGWFINDNNQYQKNYKNKTVILKNKYSPITDDEWYEEIIKNYNINVHKICDDRFGILIFNNQKNSYYFFESNNEKRTGLLYYIALKKNIIIVD